MDVDGKNYNLQKNPKQIALKELTQDSKSKLAQLFSLFDNGDKILTTQELKNAFSIFASWDTKDKNGQSDNKITNAEIQKAINTNKKLKGFTVDEVKNFLKSILSINEKNISIQAAEKQSQVNKQAAIIAKELYDQINGPSLNKNTIEKLKKITKENAAQVLYEYEEIAGESLIDALDKEWNFKISDIAKYVCQPLINQASNITKGHYSYNISNIKDIKKFVYDMNSIIGYEKPNKEKPTDIAKFIYNQIKGPSLNKNTIRLMHKINSKNAAQVISEYKKLAGESLADAIDEEWGLDYETVKNHLVSKLIRQGKSEKVYIDYDYSKNMYGKYANNTFIDKVSDNIIKKINERKYIPSKINPKDYSLEKLKQKYPKCTVRQNGNQIQVRNKDGKFRIDISVNNDGEIRIEKQYGSVNIISYYDKNGQKQYGCIEEQEGSSYLTRQDTVKKLVENIIQNMGKANAILNNIKSKKIEEDFFEISSYKVIEVMNEFKKQTGKSLFDAIENDFHISDESKEYFIKKFRNNVVEAINRMAAETKSISNLCQQQTECENGVLAMYCTNKDFPETSRKAFINKVYKLIYEKVRSMDPKNMEKSYTEEEMFDSQKSVSAILINEKALPQSYRQKMLKQIEEKLSQSIENMDVFDYIFDTLKSDYDDTKHPTKVDLIIHESGLSSETKAKLLKQLKDKILKEYFSGIEDLSKADDISKAIDKEIKHLASNHENAKGELLDNLFIKLTSSRNLFDNYKPEKELKMPNGKIDDVSYQGNTGDCWLLAVINALSKSPKGLELLNNSIKVNKDKSVTVTLKGVNKTYTFSIKELINSNELAVGDLDVRALEKAVEKYMMTEKHEDINGGFADVAYEILVGNKKNIWSWHVNSISDNYLSIINNPNTVITVSFSDEKNKIKSDSGEELHSSHEYTVAKADKNYVYLINPWDSGSLIKVTHKKFRSVFKNIYEMQL